MIRTSIETIQQWVHASLYGCPDPKIEIQGVSIDSRQIDLGTLYIPIIGARVDGHSFIEDVKKHGASASFWRKDHTPYPEGIPLILVDDTLEAMHEMARGYLKELDCTIIGITGSNGKTSCKDMMQSVLPQRFITQCTQGNRNSEFGLPLTIFEFEPNLEVGILEMGLEHPGDLDVLCSIAAPDISVLTSVGSAHMVEFGGQEGIAKGKLEILSNTKPNGRFYYHKESAVIEKVLPSVSHDGSVCIQSFGYTGDIHIEGDIEHLEEGIRFQTNVYDQPFFVPVWGDFQAINALPVIDVAKQLGLSYEQVKAGLQELNLTKMRTNKTIINQAIVLDDTYKSNPESAKVALDTLMTLKAEKHIAVLADMLDLGEEENRLHEEVGEYAVQIGVDAIYCIGERSRHTANACREKGQWFAEKAELISRLKEEMKHSCAILVKGSRAMAMETIIEGCKENTDE